MGFASVAGTGYYLPKKVVLNEAFDGQELFYHDENGSPFLENGKPKSVLCSSDWVVKNMGASERRYAGQDEYAHDLAAEAARRALDDSGVRAEDLEGIIVATSSARYRYPSSAALVTDALGARHVHNAFDISAACGGYNVALGVGRDMVERSGKSHLIIAADTLSKHIKQGNVNQPLFGDGAGAAVLSYSLGPEGIRSYYSRCDPFSGKSHFIINGADDRLIMVNGPAVFREAVSKMSKAAEFVTNEAGWQTKDIYLVPHQANIRIIEAIREKMGLSQEQVYVNIGKYANMSAATYAVGLAEAREKNLVGKNSKVVMTAIGSGLLCTAISIQL
jgi:3-oxoacyl-[acyl-carrier-protein] synthase-3